MSETVPASVPRKRRMSPDAARVALVLITSWVLVALLTAIERLWVAVWDRQTLDGSVTAGHWPQPPPGVVVDLVLVLLTVYAYPAVFAGGILASVYLAVGRRRWWRAAAVGVVTLGGAVAAGFLSLFGRFADLAADAYSWVAVWWALGALVVPLVVMAVSWLMLRQDVAVARREAHMPGVGTASS